MLMVSNRRKVSPTLKRVAMQPAMRWRVGGPGEPPVTWAISWSTSTFWQPRTSCRTLPSSELAASCVSSLRSHSYTATGLLASGSPDTAASSRQRLLPVASILYVNCV